jgi:hypothetical protein
MTLADLVTEQAPQLDPVHIQHMKLADIFTIAYKSNLIGYYDPHNNKLMLDGAFVKQLEV